MELSASLVLCIFNGAAPFYLFVITHLRALFLTEKLLTRYDMIAIRMALRNRGYAENEDDTTR